MENYIYLYMYVCVCVDIYVIYIHIVLFSIQMDKGGKTMKFNSHSSDNFYFPKNSTLAMMFLLDVITVMS